MKTIQNDVSTFAKELLDNMYENMQAAKRDHSKSGAVTYMMLNFARNYISTFLEKNGIKIGDNDNE